MAARRTGRRRRSGTRRAPRAARRARPRTGSLTRGHDRPPRPRRAALRAGARGARRTARRRPTPAGTSAAASAGSRQRRRAARPPRRSSRRRAAARGRGSPRTAARATASGSPAPWCTHSAAPWSISHRFPCQRSRFGLRGVRSTFSTSASSHTTAGRQLRRPAARAGEYGSEPGRKSTPRFSPALARIRSWISGSGSARASSGSSSTSTSSGTGSPSRARQLADHDLGRERLRALAGAAELDHVQAVVVGLHDRRQRAALAQRGHVAGGGHGPQHGWHDGARCRRCCGSRPPSWSSGP